ncbi:VOC family protein [Natronosalvus rutilus]|uniref:VOC family protein n=1 Tax=Natronosalvus rutilus TaxID=2953753 RepID=A0A9E7SZ87_9EURY|nr:VOC family protein [Natronosalvus rutilus]UTF55738.1 VOC family protein [Natronosalvus rutilus]
MFTKIHHIAFVVADIEDAMQRFEDNYDMTLVNRDEVTGAFSMDVALYNAGDNIVELIEPLGDSGWTYDVLQEQGEGWFHIAFEVDDIRESMKELESRGIRVKDDEPQEGYDWEVVTLDERDTIVPMQIVEEYN